MIETIEEYNQIREALMTVEKSKLADAFLKLALESRSVEMMIMSLVSSPTKKIALFKENIHAITHQGRGSRLSGEEILETLTRSLDLLDGATMDPKVGLQLMALFYEADSWALESTTELDYEFELVFTDDGFKKFAQFAQRCPDPDFVVQLVKQLIANDGYGMRTKLRDEASSFLTEAGLKALRT